MSGYASGSIVGYATDSTLSNLHSSSIITMSGGSYTTGGLVGVLDGGSLSESSFSGSLSDSNLSYSWVGGLVGVVQEATLTDSYNAGSITNSNNDTNGGLGGVVGWMLTGSSVANVYSSGQINNYPGPYNFLSVTGFTVFTGGLVGGADEGALSNSFSASPSNTPPDTAAIVGTNGGGTFSNVYYDQALTQQDSCVGYGTSITCTDEDDSGDSAAYFYSSKNEPLSSWNFSTVWQETDSYPILQDQAGFNDLSGIPNNGDGNGDGTLDSYQANVGDVKGSDGIWSTIKADKSSSCTLGNEQSSPGGSAPSYPGYKLVSDLTDFDVYCPTVGLTVPVTIYFSNLYNTNGAILLFYNPTTKTYTKVNNATFNTVDVGGKTETSVSYSVTDGGRYDLSSGTDGLIEDPVVIAIPVSSSSSVLAPSAGYGNPTNKNLNSFVILAISGILITSAVILKRNMTSSKLPRSKRLKT